MELYNDDCFNILNQIEKKIDLVIVDLPYGQTHAQWDCAIDLKKMWEQLKLICKDNCVYVFFTTTKYGIDIINSNRSWFRYDIVWEKSNSVGFLNANKQPLRNHEMIYIFYNKTGTYNPQKSIGKPYCINRKNKSKLYGKVNDYIETNNTGQRFPVSIIKNDSVKKKHPTAKPIDLLESLIKTYSNENENVLDFTMGIGSTGLACLNTNRFFIGIEKEKKFFDILLKELTKNCEIVN
jgi:site-specific DNA-methyltransferase (adenine-specific)